MQQVADNVYRLGSKGHNYYLIRDGDSLTVIDAGCSREWNKLSAAVWRAMGLQLSAVDAVLVTHVHSDHIGLGKRAQEERWPVYVNSEDEARALGTYEGRFSAKATDLPLLSLQTWRNMWPMMVAGGHETGSSRKRGHLRGRTGIGRARAANRDSHTGTHRGSHLLPSAPSRVWCSPGIRSSR